MTGELANGATTDDTRPTFHGTGTPGDLINISAVPTDADGHALSNVTLGLGSALVQQDGTWQLTAPFAIKEGSYDFYVGHGVAEGDAFHLVIDRGQSLNSDSTAQMVGQQGWELDMATFNVPANDGPAAGKSALPSLHGMLETGESVLPFSNAASNTGGHEHYCAPLDVRPAQFDELAQHVVI
ncbi:Ig-like domain-containing protein [Pseudomonas sp.]|uniref:Ig-like domain-containing protein n=1 Tax=Pseudomonas sp. TaxID=306 RepID=UPI00290694D1|nr:Ig-like domain-containing protein [Pseudomonas sp.]MDU4251019.1 Ig-like domain-containing protein [Pseudomonas sp.]